MKKNSLSIIVVLILTVFILFRANISISLASGQVWSGPTTQIIRGEEGTRLLINGQKVNPIYLELNGESEDIANNNWTIFDYELKMACQNGIPIIGVEPLNRHPYHLDTLIQHLNQYCPQAYLIPRFYLNPYETELAGLMKAMSPDGNIINHSDFRVLSQAWIDQRKQLIRDFLQYLDSKYPGKIIGAHFAYFTSQEWFTAPLYTDGKAYYVDYSDETASAFCQWLQQNKGTTSCKLPTVFERSKANYGNIFLYGADDTSSRAIAYNRFFSEMVSNAIISMAQEIKNISGNKALTMTIYGYFYELGAIRPLSSSGHLAMDKLLKSKAIDAIIAPYSYLYGRNVGDAMFPSGPADSPGLYGKIWFTEDDTRTILCQKAPISACTSVPSASMNSLASTQNTLKRNIITSALHGNGHYFFDLMQKGWFGRPDAPAESQAIWQTISESLNQVSKIKTNSETPYEPEIAVFVDDYSQSFLPVHPDVTTNGVDGGQFMQFLKALVPDMAANIARSGAPVRHYMLSDLLQSNFPAQKIKLALFLNTVKMTTPVRLAIRQKLENGGKTLVYTYASGLIGDVDAGPTPDNIADLTGLPVKQGYTTSQFLRSNFTYGGVSENFGDFSFKIDPWFFIEPVDTSMAVLGNYIDATPRPSVVKKDFGTYKVIYSATPGLSAKAFREIAKQAGVHIFTSQEGDVVEAMGNTIMVYAKGSGTRTIYLPMTAKWVIKDNGDSESQICTSCSSFNVSLTDGETAIFRWGMSTITVNQPSISASIPNATPMPTSTSTSISISTPTSIPISTLASTTSAIKSTSASTLTAPTQTSTSTSAKFFTPLNCSQYSSSKDKLMCNYFNTLLQLYNSLIKLLQAKISN